MLHKYNGRQLTMAMHLFNKEVIDHEGNPFMFLTKAPEEFYERITALLPMHISFLSNEELLRTLEVLVEKNLGSERLFKNYIYMQIERRVLNYDANQYERLLRALADKGIDQDRQFWQIVLKWVYERARPKGGERIYNNKRNEA